MKQMIDYEVVIKEFFQSAIRWLVARQPRDVTEQKQIATAIARFRLLLQDPKKYTEWYELYNNFGDFMGMIVQGAKAGQFNNKVYVAATAVLSDICEYYKSPKNSWYQERLEKSLKKYYLTISENIFKRAQYSIMSTQHLMQNLSNQKTK